MGIRQFSKLTCVALALTVSCKKDAPEPTPLEEVATVQTGIAIQISDNSMSVSGEVTSEGSAAVTSRGIVYSTVPAPTLGSGVVVSGSGLGEFTAELTELELQTIYYARAFATNEFGTAYGLQISFSCPDVPQLTTNVVSDIFGDHAASGGTITSNGGAEITAKGVCWSTTANPTIANDKTSDGNGSGNYTSNLTGLNPQTTYHVRAYATNIAGTSYGQEVTFTTPCLSTLGGTISYVTVVTSTSGLTAPCSPSVSGTTTFSSVVSGYYNLGDASFGLFGCSYNDSPAVGILWIDTCNSINVVGADQYGDQYTFTIVSNNGISLVLDWSNTFGDAGTSTLTRTGGWPLGLVIP